MLNSHIDFAAEVGRLPDGLLRAADGGRLPADAEPEH